MRRSLHSDAFRGHHPHGAALPLGKRVTSSPAFPGPTGEAIPPVGPLAGSWSHTVHPSAKGMKEAWPPRETSTDCLPHPRHWTPSPQPGMCPNLGRTDDLPVQGQRPVAEPRRPASHNSFRTQDEHSGYRSVGRYPVGPTASHTETPSSGGVCFSSPWSRGSPCLAKHFGSFPRGRKDRALSLSTSPGGSQAGDSSSTLQMGKWRLGREEPPEAAGWVALPPRPALTLLAWHWRPILLCRKRREGDSQVPAGSGHTEGPSTQPPFRGRRDGAVLAAKISPTWAWPARSPDGHGLWAG